MADQDQGTGNQGGAPAAPNPAPTSGPSQSPSPQAPGQGMQVNVTPQSPASPTTFQPIYTKGLGKGKGFDFPHSKRLMLIGLAVVIVLVLVGTLVVYVLPGYSITTSTVLTSTSTVPTITAGYLSTCGSVSKPGQYYLSNNIKYSSTVGPCMNVTSSSVSIICNGYGITGSGPYNGTGPFSYGIEVTGASNVSISGCSIGSFSYGIYTSMASSFKISNNNITRNYVSSIYLGQSTNGTIQNNLITNSTGPYGAIGLFNGSTGITVQNDTLKENVFRGITVNSTGNIFRNNSIIGSQYSFVCSATFGFPKSNIAYSNTCFNETGCDFVTCNGINAPANVSQILLTQQISSCGSIGFPGNYSIESNINMETYTNLPPRALAAYAIPCIKIASDNVNLNCNGHTITNAYAGIVVLGHRDTLENCRVNDSYIGILFNGTNTTALSSSLFSNDSTGIKLVGSQAGSITNIIEQNGTYGIYYQNTGTTTLSNFSVRLNTYGIYMLDSLGNLFVRGLAAGDTKFDVFGDPISANSSANLMSDTSCNITDTQWATCKLYISNPSFITFPLSACTDIKRHGLYNLTQDIFLGQTDCINIQASNVTLNCEGFNITGPNVAQNGPAIYVSGEKNITIQDCGTYLFDDGLVVRNSTRVHVRTLSATLSGEYGVLFDNVTNSTIANSNVVYASNASIELNGSRHITVLNNSMSLGRANDYGIYILNTSNSRIVNNSGLKDYLGLQLSGIKSTNDTVSNNIFSATTSYDYSCDQYSSSLLSNESGGINYGATKNGCLWMAVIPVGSSPLDCPLLRNPGTIVFTQDYVYVFGSTCYGVFANDTTIDCAGHTVLATNGGTFAYFKNNIQPSGVEGCNLKGFTTPIKSFNASLFLDNDTIYENHTNLTSSTPVVNATNGQGFYMKQTLIKTTDVGVSVKNITYGTVQANNVTGGIAYYLNKVDSIDFESTNSSMSSGIGAYVINSINNIFMGNRFDGISYGLFCQGISINSFNNTDDGSNICSSNNQCNWITLSDSTCH